MYAMERERRLEDSGGSLSEPHGLCHVSKVIEWMLNYEGSSKADREGGDGEEDRPTSRAECGA